MQLMYLGEIVMYKLKKEEIRDIGLNFVFSQMKILTPMGRNRIKNLEIFGKDNKEKLLVEFSNISYCLDNIINRKEVYTQFASILSKIKDISGTITNLKKQRTLDIVELYEVKLFSYYVNSLIKEQIKLILTGQKEVKHVKTEVTISPENLPKKETTVIENSHQEHIIPNNYTSKHVINDNLEEELDEIQRIINKHNPFNN